VIQKSTSLKYEPSSEQVRVSVHSRSDDETAFGINSSISVPESTRVSPHGLSDLRVDGATFDHNGNQVVTYLLLLYSRYRS